MGLFSALFEKRSTLANPSAELIEALVGPVNSASGKKIDATSAMRASAVYACVRILAETAGRLPLKTYRPLPDDGREVARDDYRYRLLRKQPNARQNAFEWKETTVGHLALYGNSFSVLQRNGGRRITGLYPWPPGMVTVTHDNRGLLSYKLETGKEPLIVKQEDMLHTRLLTLKGELGLSPIAQSREAIGLALSEEEHGARLFSNGALHRGIISRPVEATALSKADEKNLLDSFNQKFMGVGNAHKTAIFQEGMKYTPVSMTADDAQFLESRKFQVEEIARIFGIPLHMIQSLDHATNNNIEHQAIQFVVNSLGPWLVRIEEAINLTLFPDEENFVEFKVDALLRGDIKSRYEAYSSGIQNGHLKPNEARALELRNPTEGGDKAFIPLNLGPLENAGEMQPAGPTGAPPAEAASLRQSRAQEIRQENGDKRRALRESFKPLIEQSATRVVRAEVRELRKKIKEVRGKRDLTVFKIWLDSYYATFPEVIRAQMGGVVNAMSDQAVLLAAAELGVEAPADLIGDFAEEYLNTLSARHIGSSRGQINGLETFEEIEERLEEWLEKRPGKMRDREAVQLGDAVALLALGALGAQELRWSANRDACPLCRPLDGKVVSVETPFILKGGRVEPDDDETQAFDAGTNIRHAPLHANCDCTIVAA